MSSPPHHDQIAELFEECAATLRRDRGIFAGPSLRPKAAEVAAAELEKLAQKHRRLDAASDISGVVEYHDTVLRQAADRSKRS